MKRCFAVAAALLIWGSQGQGQEPVPGQFADYGTTIGLINEDGIPELRTKPEYLPKKPPKPPKALFPVKLDNVTWYGHTVGYVDEHGTAVLENAPPWFFTSLNIVTQMMVRLGYAGILSSSITSAAIAANTPTPTPALPVLTGVSAKNYWLNCPPASFFLASGFTVSADPGASAGALGGLSALAFTLTQDATGTPVLHTSDGRFDGMKGMATPAPNGTQYTFTDTRLVQGNNSKVTITFTVPNAASGQAQSAPTNVTVSVLADADISKGATVWMTSSVTISSQDVAACFNPAATGDPVAVDTGEYLLDPAPDLSLGGPLPLEFSRHYGSLLKANLFTGAMGENWMNNFEVRMAVNGNSANVTIYGGAAIYFNKSGNNWVLAQAQPFTYQLAQSGANYQFVDAQSNLIYTFNSGGQLTAIQDRNGNTLTVTPSGPGPSLVADGFGRTLTFTYNTNGNLVSVKDQTGRTVSFNYAGGSISSVTDANGKVTSYSYTSSNGRTSLMATVKRPVGNTTITQTWDGQARAAKQTDALSNATTFAYASPAAGSGSVTDPLGDKTQYDHPDTHNNTTITDANGKVTTIVYDAANRPVQITDPLGNKTIITYDQFSGLPATLTDASGAVTSAGYAAQTQGGLTFFVLGKLTAQDGNSTSYTYDGNGNLLTITDPNGKVTTMTYNKQGQVLTIKNALGGVTTYAYNADGTMASVQSAAGDTTQVSYDALKRPVKLTHPDGTSEAYAYDALGRLAQHTPAAGAAETYTYDDNGNLLTHTDLSGGVVAQSFDANDAQVSLKNAVGATWSATYDAAGRTTAITNGAGEKMSTTYDAVGQPLAVLDAAGNGRHFAWSAAGFLQSVTDATNHATTVTTDAVGRILTSTSPLNEKTSIAYDKAGRPVTITSPLGHTAKFTYDAAGNLTRLDLPVGISAAMARNELGEVATLTDPNGSVWKHGYDTTGRLNAATDPLGQTTTIQYDARNRRSGATNPAGSVTLTRDALGNVTGASFSDGTMLSYQWGPGSRLTGADNLALGYDANGDVVMSNGIVTTRDGARRITSITYGPGLTVTYKYGNTGNLIEIDDWTGGATTFTYDAAHRLMSVTRPNGTVTQYTRDADGRITGSTETTATAFYSFALTLNAEGKVTVSYRSMPQLPQPAGGFNGYTFDAASQISGATYDAAGRLLSDGLRTYTWDGASRLLSYAGVDGSAQFTYDGLGMRVARITPGGEEDYVLNYAHPAPVVATVQTGGADLRYYVYLPSGSPLYSIEAADNTHHYYHYDESGSTAFLTDDSGSVSDAYGITPFGESVTQNGTTENPFTFHGAYGVMQEGGTSLYYMRARYYDSAPAHFLSRDPASSGDPRQMDPYQFAMNNPVSNHDARGLSAEGSPLSGAQQALVQYMTRQFLSAIGIGGAPDESALYAAAYRDGFQNLAFSKTLTAGTEGQEYYQDLGFAILNYPETYLNFLHDKMYGYISAGMDFFDYLDDDYDPFGATSVSIAVFAGLLAAWVAVQWVRRKRLAC